MGKLPFLLFHLSCLPIVSTVTDQHALVRVRWEKSLFELASTAARNILNEEVTKIPLPGIDDSFAGIKVRTRWMRWTGFEAPRTNFSISEEGFQWNTAGGVVKIEIHFVAKWFIFTKTGFAYFTARDLRTQVQATVHNEDSRPQIDLKTCMSWVGDVSVDVHAQITGFFIKTFSRFIEDFLEDVLRKEMCKLVSRFVVQGNKFVMDQPEEIPIWNGININYSTIGEPSFQSDAIEITSAFRFLFGNFSANLEEVVENAVVHDVRDESPIRYDRVNLNLSLYDVLLYSAALIGALNILANCRK